MKKGIKKCIEQPITVIDKQGSSALLTPQENKRPESRKHQKKKCNLPPLQPIRRKRSTRERSHVVDHVVKCCQMPANLQLRLPAMLPKRPTTVRPQSPRAAMRLDVLAEPSDALTVSCIGVSMRLFRNASLLSGPEAPNAAFRNPNAGTYLVASPHCT